MHRRPTIWHREQGAVSAEFVAGLLVVAGLVAVVLALGIDDTTRQGGDVASCQLFEADGADCGTIAAAGSGPGDESAAGDQGGTGDEGGTQDRRDTARDARGDRRDGGRGDDTQVPPSVPDDATPPEVLGDPVDGNTAPTPPPPPWEPVDPGAGEHDSAGKGIRTRGAEFLAETAANAMSGTWPDASRNLLHYLGNSGEPLEQDVDTLLDDVPEFAADVDTQRNRLAALAVERARDDGADGAVTFPLSTTWNGFGYDAGGLTYDDDNWFYALGGWQYSVTGTVTVTPPADTGGDWTWSMDSSVHLRDQYNWDGEKATQIGPFTVTDQQLAQMHREGLAQEYTNHGESTATTTEGSTP